VVEPNTAVTVACNVVEPAVRHDATRGAPVPEIVATLVLVDTQVAPAVQSDVEPSE
jgi:hypothetical protein